MNLSEFFAMGGYAFYVWTAYGITAFMLLANILLPLRRHRAVQRELAQAKRRREQNP